MIDHLRSQKGASPLPLKFQLAQPSHGRTAPSTPHLAHHRRLGSCDRLALFLFGQVSPTHPTRRRFAQRFVKPSLGLGLDAELPLSLVGMGNGQERLGYAGERGGQLAMA
jgi:hypothetical protein